MGQVIRCGLAFDCVEVTAEAVDDLPAIATGGTPAHGNGFEHHHTETGFGQEQCGRQPGVTSTDHAHISLANALKRRPCRGRIGRCRVIGWNRGMLGHGVVPNGLSKRVLWQAMKRAILLPAELSLCRLSAHGKTRSCTYMEGRRRGSNTCYDDAIPLPSRPPCLTLYPPMPFPEHPLASPSGRQWPTPSP